MVGTMVGCGSRWGDVARQRLFRLLKHESSQASGLLALPAETKACLLSASPALGIGPVVALVQVANLLSRSTSEDVGHIAGGRCTKLRAHVLGSGQNTLGFCAPSPDRALLLCAGAEDQTKEHVNATEGEQEEGGDQGEVISVVREDLGCNQALEDTEGTETELRAEDGEEAVEERHGPADLREEQDDGLEDDKESCNHSPENTSRLVRDSASLNIITVDHLMTRSTVQALVGLESVDSLDIRDHYHDRTCEDKDERDYAQSSNDVQSNKI